MLLKTKTRKLQNKKVKILREKGLIPAVVYGHGFSSQNLEVEYLAFQKIYELTGGSELVDLQIDEREPIKVLIYDVQTDPLKDRFIHIDFYKVKMTEKIAAEIELEFVGTSSAQKELGGVLVKNLDKIEVKCLPQDLVHKIEVDISSLKTFDETVCVKDLKVPYQIEVLNKEDEVVARVMPPRTEKELEELEEKPEEKVEEIEKVEEKEKEVAGEEKETEIEEKKPFEKT